MKNLVKFLLILIVFFSSVMADGHGIKKGTTIYIGVETNIDWAPYEFIKRQDGKSVGSVIGFNVDVLDEIFAKNGLKYEFVTHPWKRLLIYLDSNNGVDFIFPTALMEERGAKYLVSNKAYTITPSYFYMKKKYPNGLPIKSSQDLFKEGTVCGKHSYNYTNFGIDNKKVDRGAISLESAFQKLKAGRCGTMLGRYEIMAALHLVGKSYLTDDIAHAPIPQIKGEDFYYMISKKYKYAKELQKILDDGIAELRESGKLDEILKKYIK